MLHLLMGYYWRNKGFRILIWLILLFMLTGVNTFSKAQTQAPDTLEYEELITRLDTVSQWIKRKPSWDRYDRHRESKLFDSLLLKIERELLVILSHPLAVDQLPLKTYLNVVSSPDEKLRLINCGSSNIYGTGNYYMNLVQVINGEDAKAYPFQDDLYYSIIDTMMYQEKPIYVLAGQSIHTVRFKLSSYMTYSINGLELVPYNSFGGEHSIGLIHDWMTMDAGFDLNFNGVLHLMDIRLEVFGVYGVQSLFGLSGKDVRHEGVYPAKLNGFLFFANGEFVWVPN